MTPVLSVFVYGEAATSLMTGSVDDDAVVLEEIISSERKKLFCMCCSWCMTPSMWLEWMMLSWSWISTGESFCAVDLRVDLIFIGRYEYDTVRGNVRLTTYRLNVATAIMMMMMMMLKDDDVWWIRNFRNSASKLINLVTPCGWLKHDYNYALLYYIYIKEMFIIMTQMMVHFLCDSAKLYGTMYSLTMNPHAIHNQCELLYFLT